MESESEVYAVLTEIFRDIFMRDDLVLSPSLSARDVVGWDSFKQIEIIVAAEEHFKIKLNTREVDGLKNVGDLAGIVALKMASR